MKRVAYSLLDLADRVIFDVAENLSEMDVECYFVACRDIDFVVDKTKFLVFDINLAYTPDKQNVAKFIEFYKNDRSLKFFYSEQEALSLMQYWYEKSSEFLIKNKITHIFIEGTPTYELILELVCSRLSLSVLNLFHAPGPIGYMLISSSSVEHLLIKNNGRNPTYYKQIKGRNSGRKVYAQPESKLVKLLRF